MAEDADSSAALAAEVELLRVENDRLRERLDRSQRKKHVRATAALATAGLAALVGAVFFPFARELLIALGATGVFGAILVVYLTPERFVSSSVGEGLYRSVEADRQTILEQLDVRGTPIYVPVETARGAEIRLFVPQHGEYAIPQAEYLDAVFVTTSNELARGVAFDPTGTTLGEELRRSVPGGLADDPETLASQLADGLVETFELVDAAETDVDEKRLSIVVTNSAYGPVDRLDHPIASLVGTTVAEVTDGPVTVEVETRDGGEYLISARWEGSEADR